MKKRTVVLAFILMLVAVGSLAAQQYYIPLISKGFQHQFWQAVKQGAEQAAKRPWRDHYLRRS